MPNSTSLVFLAAIAACFFAIVELGPDGIAELFSRKETPTNGKK